MHKFDSSGRKVWSAFERIYTTTYVVRVVVVAAAPTKHRNQASGSPEVIPAHDMVWEAHFCRALGRHRMISASITKILDDLLVRTVRPLCLRVFTAQS
jgi:hypothetical protein